MTAPKPWELLSTDLLHDCRIFTLSAARTRSPHSGEPHEFYRIDSADWVNIVPLTDDGQVVMVRQFRHGLGDVTLEIPGGMVDPGEDPGAAGARELREETGYRAGRVRRLGAVNPNPAVFGNRVHTYLAEGCVREGAIRNSATEETVLELVPAEEIPERVRAGEIDHALVIAALHFWEIDRMQGG